MKFKGRYIFVALSLLAVIGGLVWRVVTLQVVDQAFLRHQGDMRTVRVAEMQAYRGMITDRHGDPLAISTPVSSVWVNPQEFDSSEPQLIALAALLETSVEKLKAKMAKHQGREFAYLKRHIAPNIAEQVRSLDIAGIYLKSEFRRFYPTGEVTAHVVGFTDVDDHGKEGLELAYEQWLSGVNGSKRVVRDRKGREIQVLAGIKETQSGQDVALSLDQRLQYLAYRELKAAVAASQAIAGTAVVLDVATGEVLAMVNQPSFNPNHRVKLRTDDRFQNRAVTQVMEPGSVMKTFSVVNALQHGNMTASTPIDTAPGWMVVGKNIVKEDKQKNFGVIDVSTVLQKSSNVGVAKLTLALSADCLFDTYSKLGFGALSGSGFPGERMGVLVKPAKNSHFVLATMAFGYAMSVTPLQLAQAYAVLGAGGVKRPVTFLKQDETPRGEQVLDPVVAKQAVDMLEAVVMNGSGKKAKVVGYHTAGKTGTARKLSAQGRYLEDSHIAVFAGVVPASNPRFAIVVMIDDPKHGLYYGGQVAAPLFAKIASGAVRLFNIAPDELENSDEKWRLAQANKITRQHE